MIVSHVYIVAVSQTNLRYVMGVKCERKKLSHWKNLIMSTEGTHSKLLHLLFEMPPKRHHVWKVERKFNIERMPRRDSFNLFY